MSYSRILALAFILSIFSLSYLSAADETLTITTYYPSPYGSYRELTAHRMKIGTTYSGSGTIVSDNNLIVEGNVGIGTSTPKNKLDVEGGLAVGAGYSGTSVAPTNGAIIQGKVGIGTDLPSGILDVYGGTAADGIPGLPIQLESQSGGSGDTSGGNIILWPGSKSGTGTDGKVCIKNSCISTWVPACDWSGDIMLSGTYCTEDNSFQIYARCTNKVLVAVGQRWTINGCKAAPPSSPPPYPS